MKVIYTKIFSISNYMLLIISPYVTAHPPPPPLPRTPILYTA